MTSKAWAVLTYATIWKKLETLCNVKEINCQNQRMQLLLNEMCRASKSIEIASRFRDVEGYA